MCRRVLREPFLWFSFIKPTAWIPPPGIAAFLSAAGGDRLRTLDELELLKRKTLLKHPSVQLMAGNVKQSAAPFLPEDRTLPILRKAVQKCRGCDLYRNATQAVFGELESGGRVKKPQVTIMMIGEQPGDHEDKDGRPFVGPAGRLLDKCIEEAEIDRREVYVTNTVKHFKWEPRGKLRIHKKPNMQEIHACRPWLEAELAAVRPKLIVCLGAVAAQSLLGSSFKITRTHGQIQQAEGFPPIIATLHPSAILRARTEEDRQSQLKTLVDDLREVAKFVS
jgi:uracil-DNA glycosylase family protein